MSTRLDEKPPWERALELAERGASLQKIAFVLDCDRGEAARLVGRAYGIISNRQGPVKAPKTFAEWMIEPYTDPEVRAWMRREVEAWEARQK